MLLELHCCLIMEVVTWFSKYEFFSVAENVSYIGQQNQIAANGIMNNVSCTIHYTEYLL